MSRKICLPRVSEVSLDSRNDLFRGYPKPGFGPYGCVGCVCQSCLPRSTCSSKTALCFRLCLSHAKPPHGPQTERCYCRQERQGKAERKRGAVPCHQSLGRVLIWERRRADDGTRDDGNHAHAQRRAELGDGVENGSGQSVHVRREDIGDHQVGNGE